MKNRAVHPPVTSRKIAIIMVTISSENVVLFEGEVIYQNQADKRWEWRKISIQGFLVDPMSNSPRTVRRISEILEMKVLKESHKNYKLDTNLFDYNASSWAWFLVLCTILLLHNLSFPLPLFWPNQSQESYNGKRLLGHVLTSLKLFLSQKP